VWPQLAKIMDWSSGSQTFPVRGPLRVIWWSAKHKILSSFSSIPWFLLRFADHFSQSRGPPMVRGADFGNHCIKVMVIALLILQHFVVAQPLLLCRQTPMCMTLLWDFSEAPFVWSTFYDFFYHQFSRVLCFVLWNEYWRKYNPLKPILAVKQDFLI